MTLINRQAAVPSWSQRDIKIVTLSPLDAVVLPSKATSSIGFDNPFLATAPPNTVPLSLTQRVRPKQMHYTNNKMEFCTVDTHINSEAVRFTRGL